MTPPVDVRTERLNRGFSRRGLAREVGVPEATLRRLEEGLGVTPAYAKKVADYFDVRVVDIMPIGPRAAA